MTALSMTLRNRDRITQKSGYGRINAGLHRHLGLSLDDLDADIHIFASPPYSFYTLQEERFNVGLTYCDGPLSQYKNFDFAGLCNKLDLILTASELDRQTMQEGGVTAQIEIAPPGLDHNYWRQPIRRQANKRVFIFSRGRDCDRQIAIARKYFSDVDLLINPGLGELEDENLKERYGEADIFLKWANEYAWSYPTLEAMSAGCLVVTNCPYVYLTPQNSITFYSEDHLHQILSECRKNAHYDKKLQAQADMLNMNWEQAAARILEIIYTEYRKRYPAAPQQDDT